jgi:hypothetical protein
MVIDMYDAELYLDGTIAGVRSGVFKAPDTGKEEPYGFIQLTGRDGTSAKMYEVSLAAGFDIKRYAVGTKVRMPVRVGASKDGKRIYYREAVPAAATGPAGANQRSQADEVPRSTSKL